MFARHHWRTDNHLAALGLIETGLGWGLAATRAWCSLCMAAGTLVEMPFENLSNGAALWVDVVWSKERPPGLGRGGLWQRMNDNQALQTETV